MFQFPLEKYVIRSSNTPERKKAVTKTLLSKNIKYFVIKELQKIFLSFNY